MSNKNSVCFMLPPLLISYHTGILTYSILGINVVYLLVHAKENIVESRIIVNGEDYSAPKKGETLHVQNTGKHGRVRVSIQNVTGTIHIEGGGSRRTETTSSLTLPPGIDIPNSIGLNEIERMCLFISRGAIKKADLNEELNYYQGLQPSDIEAIYEHNQQQKGWTPWNELA